MTLLDLAIHDLGPWEMAGGDVVVPVRRRMDDSSVTFVGRFRPGDFAPLALLDLRCAGIPVTYQWAPDVLPEVEYEVEWRVARGRVPA